MGCLRRELEYFFGALRFFTRLPVPAWVGHSSEGLNRAARYFPAVGLLVGAIAALAFALAALVWPKAVAVLAAMAATIYVTGAFHEDGLSDMVDGFGGGWAREQVLTIMKDSRVGSYGVVAIVLVLLGKFLALFALPGAALPAALVAGHAVSRGCATVLLKSLDYVREDQLAKAKPLATRMGAGELALALCFALAGVALLALYLPPANLAMALLLAAACTLWLGRLMRRRLGGYTGDCLGATQQGSELAFYLGLLWTFF
ncbi:adenosylcobinamide-GDP ribazoletransferase [Azospira sp. I09]|uniref:adenosylcobinamide-GDP ribazoletransferase n=1 Tax=Azospira sp. I09 TaxID=1765049 RepID=UPI0012604097|nr:adenosylcobinamide-GDP ribazoletransferase [Azospira sp. I09]BBN89034.1 adenosylcobinamide-GDP ribazoletransferase [Azospira sp. I09]